MIGKHHFATGMSLLADRFNRPLHEATIRQYYETLAPVLSEAEFNAAVSIAFRNSTFWPSPKEMIEMVRPPANLALEAAWDFDRLLALGKDSPSGGKYWRVDDAAGLGAPTLAAFRAIGANARLRGMTDADAPWARREFIAAHVAAAEMLARQGAAQEALLLAAGSGRAKMIEDRGSSRAETEVRDAARV